MDAAAARAPTLLGPGDPPPFAAVNREGRARALLIADHAGRAFPAALGTLGLGPDALGQHIAYDIGIEGVARRLAERLDAALLLHRYSRLVIDPNRALDDPTSICAVSDGVVVPGNRGLDAADAAARAAALVQPYQAAIAAELDRLRACGAAPALISLHSFTPAMRGLERPWHVGVLWGEDGRIARPLLAMLAEDPALVVGDNQPYSGREWRGHTVDQHARPAGLPHVVIEIRQDLVAAEADGRAWADRLAAPLAAILADDRLYRPFGGAA